MVVTLIPQINYSPKVTFKSTENQSPTTASTSMTPEDETKSIKTVEKPESTAKGILATLAYAWINLVEGTKGIVKGLLAGFLTGTAVAGIDMIHSGWKKHKNKKITLSEMFNRKKAMSKTGKILAPVAAGIVFAGNLVVARLNANKRTANVDHMLYEGHRDK